ncbi:MAG: GDSL-type esterase/lipase family protein, partial [Deltaproteobacteria bacterium]
MKGRRRSKSYAVSCLVTVLAVLTGVAIAEVYLRIDGHYSTWTERNQGRYVSPYAMKLREPWINAYSGEFAVQQPEFLFARRVNSIGLPDEEIEPRHDPGDLLIVALGDSFTVGQGARFGDDYPNILEQLVARSAHRNVRVLNAGVAGSDPVFAYQLLKRKLIGLSPDAVILLINDSDLEDIAFRGGFDRFNADGSLNLGEREPWFSEWYRLSHVVRAIAFGLGYDSFLQRKKDTQDRKKNYSPLVIEEVSKKIQDLGLKHGFQFYVFWHPMRETAKELLRQGTSSDPNFSALKQQLERAGIQAFDTTPAIMRGVRDVGMEKIYRPIDKHFSPYGYKLLSRALLERIREWIKPRQFVNKNGIVIWEFSAP